MRFVVLLFLSCVACGSTSQAPHAMELRNGVAGLDDAKIQAVIDYVDGLVSRPPKLNDYVLTISDDLQVVQENCLHSDVDGCTINNAEGGSIEIAWLKQYNKWLIPQVVLAHELGHIYYWQTTGDPDPNHKHYAEWFDAWTSPNSVCYKTFDAFLGD